MSTANAGHKVMLLVDADNVSADVMEQAVRGVIAEHGHLHVRRAYCTAEVALKHQQLFKRLSMRPMVNLAAGKNSTDIALAVDAMDLVVAERPQLVYLVSSDSDFAPLVHRLREKGCRVCGIGQQGKTGEETRAAYDHFIDLKHKGSSAAAASEAPAPRPARKTAARKTSARRSEVEVAPEVEASPPADAPVARAPARKTAARKTAASRTAAAKTRADRATASAAPAPAPSAAAQAVLDAAPALLGGAELALNDVVQALRAAKLLGKHASSLKFFDKLRGEFVLLQHPDRIRWSGAVPA